MLLTIVLRKEVADLEEARQRIDQIKEYIAPLPDVKVAAQVNTKLEPPEEPE